MIVIIDYGMGNLRSIEKAFQRLNAAVIVSNRYKEIEKANRLVLPGIGHFSNGMKKLKELDLLNVLNFKVKEQNTLILGICLGMQLMTNFSQEGEVEGLRWIDACTVKFSFYEIKNPFLKIPHMGWNNIKVRKNHFLYNNLSENDHFYFAHSYHVICSNQEDVLFSSNYGVEFTSGISHQNMNGVQFHPEKSHFSGLTLLNNFINRD